MMVGIVDYGMGNLLSVLDAVEYIGYEAMFCRNENELKKAEKIILPGVGAYKDCVKNLKEFGFWDTLNEEVINKKKYILGICLGMQIMAKKGYEGGDFGGLGWFDAEVIRIVTNNKNLKIPQVGWNNIDYDNDNLLFKGLPGMSEFYFVHSYYMKCNEKKDVIATCNYGIELTAAICKNNIFATQFHPEKSQDYGLRVLKNFLDL
ncbi:MAG TPA: imidazole glycerol phosphate synthase subunit HisH [Ignavibacteria bacterium]